MAQVTIEGDRLEIKLSFLDQLLAFHGSLSIPPAHVTNAFVSDLAVMDGVVDKDRPGDRRDHSGNGLGTPVVVVKY